MIAARWLLAIDPGADAGWSVWSRTPANGWHLTACGLGRPLFDSCDTPGVVTIERPEFYVGDDPRKVDRLFTLVTDLGRRLQDAMARFEVTEAYGVKPKTWKGGLDKDAHHAYMQRTQPESHALATPFVMSTIKSKRHNVWDAVWLGKWATDRAFMLKTVTDYVYDTLK